MTLAGLTRHVREALAHLYDPVYLQTHPLVHALGVVPGYAGGESDGEASGEKSPAQAGRLLRQRLLDAIARLRPETKASERSGAVSWRAYRLLELRYVEALPPEVVQEQLGIEKSQYYRDHARALAAVVSLLVGEADEPARTADARGQALSTSAVGGQPAPPQDAARPGTVVRLHRLTSFVGRERELATVRRLLAEGRLITLTGPGGIGKTRLALEMAAGLADAYPDGVHVVSLTGLADPSLVPAAIAGVLGVREAGSRPLVESLIEHLRTKTTLLVLDNFETVLPAAADVATLLAACPNVRALVTSRETLRVGGEHRFPVPPLALPDPASVADSATAAGYEAVVLFEARARAADPDFAVADANAVAVVEACRRLDGLPLAIELAAARMNVLTPESLLARLDDRLPLLTRGPRDAPARHQTLRAAIAWSYDLLDAPTRVMFERLGVFADGCTLEAAEVVCAVGGARAAGGRECPAVDVLDGLAALIDRSLLQREQQPDGHPRFRMLETIREFALERLEASGGANDARGRHTAFFLALVEHAEPELTGGEQAAWLDRLERDRENLRQALHWALESTQADLGLRLGSALTRFWLVRGTIGEGRRWLKTALAAGGTPVWRAKALHRAGDLAWSQGDHAAAGERLEECLALRRALGDRAGVAGALNSLGLVKRGRADYPAARLLHEEALALAREAGDQAEIYLALACLGAVAYQEGDYDTARARYEDALPVARAAGDQWHTAAALNGLGGVVMMQGDLDEARALHEEALTIRRGLGDRQGSARALFQLASVARRQGDLAVARDLFEQALPLYREQGDRWGAAGALVGLGRVAWTEGDLRGARGHYEEALAIARALGDRAGAAGALNCLGQLASLRGDSTRAAALLRESLSLSREIGVMADVPGMLETLAPLSTAAGCPEHGTRLLGAAAALRDALGLAMAPADRPAHKRSLAAARKALGRDRFAREWAAGQATPPEQAVEDALCAVSAATPPPETVPVSSAAPSGPTLTPREREVAAFVARGDSNRQVADALGISERTAENHVKHILTKLGARSRARIAAWAAKQHLPDPPRLHAVGSGRRQRTGATAQGANTNRASRSADRAQQERSRATLTHRMTRTTQLRARNTSPGRLWH